MGDRKTSNAVRRPAGRSRENLLDRSVPADPYRSIVFPNNLRDSRRKAGFASLLMLSEAIPDIPYIRLSKIERGEVFAKAAELRLVANRLRIDPIELLIDVSDPAFDMAAWAGLRGQPSQTDRREEEEAVLLAALFRRARHEKSLTLAQLEAEYGLPPVMLSRIENALKAPVRWNGQTLSAICRIVEVPGLEELLIQARSDLASGLLDDWLERVPGRAEREQKTTARVAELREQLSADAASPVPSKSALSAANGNGRHPATRTLPVFGSPLPGGLIARTPAGQEVEAPSSAGPNAFALRLCRPTLGSGMPANAVLIVDPDRMPMAGGLIVIQEGEALRVMTLSADRDGVMYGYSVHPDRQIAIDALDPSTVFSVLAVYFL